MKLEYFEEQVFFTAVKIVTAGAGLAGGSLGSGFIYITPLEGMPERTVTLLISNRHVLRNTSGSISLVFHKKDAVLDRPKFGDVLEVNESNYGSVYYEHPDPDVDLACINITNVVRPELQVFYKSVGPDLVAEFNEDRLIPGLDIYFIGYPSGVFDVKNNLPILRRGFIASIPKVDFNGRGEFMIDAQVFQGSSGSPVFATLNGRFKLLGVISSTMQKSVKVEEIPTSHSLEVKQIIGLGIVIKASRIHELICHLSGLIVPSLRIENPAEEKHA